jgi:hypothetical protein
VTATVRATGASNSGSVSFNGFSPTMPVGFVAGDLLIGIVVGGDGGVPTARPTGSTLIQNIVDGAVFNMDIVSKVAVGGDVFTWSSSALRRWAGAVVAITTGTYNAATPTQGAVGAAKGATSDVSFVTPASTPGNTDSLIIAAFGEQLAGTWTCTSTTPSMTELADTTSTGTGAAGMSVYRSATPPAASSLTRTGTASLASANGAAFMLFVNPAAAVAALRPLRRPGPNYRR